MPNRNPLRGRGIGMLFRRPTQAVQAHITTQLAERGFDNLSEAHMAVFIHIDPEGSRLTELAERAQMTVQSMGYLVDNLQARGYVERVPDRNDGRAKLIRLTERGWQVERHAADIGRGLEALWAARLGEAKFRRLRMLLEELADQI